MLSRNLTKWSGANGQWYTLIAIGGAVFIAATGSFAALNPLRYSESSVRKWVLQITPLGTDVRTVLGEVTRRGWRSPDFEAYSPTHGYVSRERGDTVGQSSLEGVLGRYYTLWPEPTYVSASWAFDKNGKLIDVQIVKDTDSP